MLGDLFVFTMTLISKHLSRRSLCAGIRIYQIWFPVKTKALWGLVVMRDYSKVTAAERCNPARTRSVHRCAGLHRCPSVNSAGLYGANLEEKSSKTNGCRSAGGSSSMSLRGSPSVLRLPGEVSLPYLSLTDQIFFFRPPLQKVMRSGATVLASEHALQWPLPPRIHGKATGSQAWEPEGTTSCVEKLSCSLKQIKITPENLQLLPNIANGSPTGGGAAANAETHLFWSTQGQRRLAELGRQKAPR